MMKWEQRVEWDKVLKVLNALDSEYEYSYAFPGKAFGPAAGKAVVRRKRDWPPVSAGFVYDPLVVLTKLVSKVNGLVEDADALLESAKELGWSIPDADYLEDDKAGLCYPIER